MLVSYTLRLYLKCISVKERLVIVFSFASFFLPQNMEPENSRILIFDTLVLPTAPCKFPAAAFVFFSY